MFAGITKRSALAGAAAGRFREGGRKAFTDETPLLNAVGGDGRPKLVSDPTLVPGGSGTKGMIDLFERPVAS